MSGDVAPLGAPAVVWQDVECGGYDADLPLWEELAADLGGPILDLGCGTGRVALHLARRGHEVVGVDVDPALVAALLDRALRADLSVTGVVADVRAVELERRFRLALAPMQLLQLVGGAEGRRRAVRCASAQLEPGGVLAAAIVEGAPAEALGEGDELVPDVRERDGWVFSSLPVGVRAAGGRIEIRRLRQAVAPDGALAEDMDVASLEVVDAAMIETEGREAGLEPVSRHKIEPTPDHVGSTAVLLERVAGS
jgi:SAM-dependent methyltransferase